LSRSGDVPVAGWVRGYARLRVDSVPDGILSTPRSLLTARSAPRLTDAPAGGIERSGDGRALGAEHRQYVLRHDLRSAESRRLRLDLLAA
jgi:hypothetical protein